MSALKLNEVKSEPLKTPANHLVKTGAQVTGRRTRTTRRTSPGTLEGGVSSLEKLLQVLGEVPKVHPSAVLTSVFLCS